MQAIILAGGFGTRLQTVVSNVPKPMAPIGDKPFLWYQLQYLKSQGIREVILSVHHLWKCIYAYFQQDFADVPIKYAVEEIPLGTGGAILNALKHADSRDHVLVLNGDSFVGFNLATLVKEHTRASAEFTMILKKMNDCSRYGQVELKDNRISAFTEKSKQTEGLINAGVYLLNPNLLDKYNLPRHFSFEKDFIYPYAASLNPLGLVVDDYFIDIGLPADYVRAKIDLPRMFKWF